MTMKMHLGICLFWRAADTQSMIEHLGQGLGAKVRGQCQKYHVFFLATSTIDPPLPYTITLKLAAFSETLKSDSCDSSNDSADTKERDTVRYR